MPEQEGFWTCGARQNLNNAFTLSTPIKLIMSKGENKLTRQFNYYYYFICCCNSYCSSIVFQWNLFSCLVTFPYQLENQFSSDAWWTSQRSSASGRGNRQTQVKTRQSSGDLSQTTRRTTTAPTDLRISFTRRRVSGRAGSGSARVGCCTRPHPQLSPYCHQVLKRLFFTLFEKYNFFHNNNNNNLFSAKINFAETPEDTSALVGTEVALKCTTNTRVDKCTWLFRPLDNPSAAEKVMQEFPSIGDLGRDCTLRLKRVSAEHQGYWSCQIPVPSLNSNLATQAAKLTVFNQSKTQL